MAAFHDGAAVIAFFREINCRLVDIAAPVVESPRENPGGCRFAHAAHAGQHPCLCDTAGFKCIFEGADHRLLADQGGEILRAIFARQDAIGPRRSAARPNPSRVPYRRRPKSRLPYGQLSAQLSAKVNALRFSQWQGRVVKFRGKNPKSRGENCVLSSTEAERTDVREHRSADKRYLQPANSDFCSKFGWEAAQ